MSFSSKVKEELEGMIPQSRHCRLAELSAIVLFSGRASHGTFRCSEETKAKAKKLIRLLNIDIDGPEGMAALKLHAENGTIGVNPMLVERACCKQAFIRGTFLTVGSLTDPEKGYHFELPFQEETHAKLLKRLIADFDISPKTIARKRYTVVYVKDSQEIVDVLSVMGAFRSLMDMENVRILKDVKNRVNRRVNCETANLEKTVNTAVRQAEDIRYIEENKGLSYLSEGLRRIAELRLMYPDMPLKELGEQLNPPLGKSGVNHRLRKISEIAKEIREEKS